MIENKIYQQENEIKQHLEERVLDLEEVIFSEKCRVINSKQLEEAGATLENVFIHGSGALLKTVLEEIAKNEEILAYYVVFNDTDEGKVVNLVYIETNKSELIRFFEMLE